MDQGEGRAKGQGTEVPGGVQPVRGTFPGREVGQVDGVVIMIAGQTAFIPVMTELLPLAGNGLVVVVVMMAVRVMVMVVWVTGVKQVAEVDVGGSAGLSGVAACLGVMDQPLNEEELDDQE
jgi:hypothetical protein